MTNSLHETLKPIIATAAKGASDAKTFANAFTAALPKGITMQLPADPEENRLVFTGEKKRPLGYSDFFALFKAAMLQTNATLAMAFQAGPATFWQALKALITPQQEPVAT